MQCEAFERRFQWLLDRRRRPETDDELLEHASQCATCGQFLAAQTRLFQSFAVDQAPYVDDDFAVRVVERLNDSPERRRSPYANPIWILAAVAAVLVVATLPFWPIAGSGTPSTQVAQNSGSPAVTSDPGSYAMNPDAAEIGQLLQWVQDLSDPSLQEFETVDHLSGGIRSLTSTISVAIDALRRNMPVTHEGMLEDPPMDMTPPAWLPRLS